jgi:alkanesulfonate monooxygenase
MPVQITGIVPHNRSTLGAPRPGSEFDIEAMRQFARTQDEAGFDRVLIANAASMPDSMAISQFVTSVTSRLGVMVAHRPGFIAPTMAARMLATLDRFSGGRTGVHIIAGASDTELQADGDFSEKETRYRRAGEYVELMRRVWAGGGPFDFDGEFYRVRGAAAMVRPESGALKVFWGGESETAIELAGRHADSYAIFGDTLAGTRPFVEAAHAAAARHGRSLEVMMTLVVIVADTEGAAWDRAAVVLERAVAEKSRNFMSDNKHATTAPGKPAARGMARILERSAEGERLDACLWTGMNKAMEGRGNNTTLVGTPEQVVDSLLEYYRLGVRGFLLRGYDIMEDAALLGRSVIPLLRSRVAGIDAGQG